MRLQGRYNELEQKHNKVLASHGGGAGKDDGYVSRLIAMANNLYDKPLYRYVCITWLYLVCLCVLLFF